MPAPDLRLRLHTARAIRNRYFNDAKFQSAYRRAGLAPKTPQPNITARKEISSVLRPTSRNSGTFRSLLSYWLQMVFQYRYPSPRKFGTEVEDVTAFFMPDFHPPATVFHR